MCEVLFIHPDLGIGGAERLIIDAAIALKKKGHKITIVTSHHDKSHCFEETKDGTIPVLVYGDWLPRNIFGYFYALCAYIRMVFIAITLLFCNQVQPDVIILDLVSIPIPILKWKTSNIIFYCHFPDQLLTSPGGTLKTMYRKPLNWLEEYTTNQAKKVFVNSKFTSEIYLKTFKNSAKVPDVLYPSLDTYKFDSVASISLDDVVPKDLPNDSILFLSINRYERKKDIGLAINAFHYLKKIMSDHDWKKCHLILAGGYDEHLLENVEYYRELKALIKALELENKVTMLKSPDDVVKISLIKSARCLIYTPANEHFGIVPVESMYLGTPVLAVNSGGPTETVLDGGTGYLLSPTPEDFGKAMLKLAQNAALAKQMGEAGRVRVNSRYSFQEFSRRLDLAVLEVTSSRSN